MKKTMMKMKNRRTEGIDPNDPIKVSRILIEFKLGMASIEKLEAVLLNCAWLLTARGNLRSHVITLILSLV